MEINDIFNVKISDMNENGFGIAKIDSAVVFVRGAVDGDNAKIRITSHEKNYYTAEIAEIIEPSPYRIVPECGSFSMCGGCTLSNINFEHENIIKQKAVASAFRRMGIDPSLVEETVSCNERKEYRNNVTLHYIDGKFAFYSEKSNLAVDIGNCKLCKNAFLTIADYMNSVVAKLEMLAPTDLHIRDNKNGDVTLSIYVKKSPSTNFKNSFTDDIRNAFYGICNIEAVNFVSGKNEHSYITDVIGDIKMRFSSEAFRQVNTPAFEKLLEIVLDMTDNLEFTSAADLYCGSGIIGLSIAKRHPKKKFIGIEINPDSIMDAKYNAALNCIENIRFYVGDSASLNEKLNGRSTPELITVDPPRAGLSKKMCNDIVKLAPRSLIYVSCNPQTLARDLKYFSENGYKINRAIPVNLFPFTKHCECVVKLEKVQ